MSVFFYYYAQFWAPNIKIAANIHSKVSLWLKRLAEDTRKVFKGQFLFCFGYWVKNLQYAENSHSGLCSSKIMALQNIFDPTIVFFISSSSQRCLLFPFNETKSLRQRSYFWLEASTSKIPPTMEICSILGPAGCLTSNVTRYD